MISRERLEKAKANGLRRAKALASRIDFFYSDRGSLNFEHRITKEEWIEHQSHKLRKTTKQCSSWCCGNPRRHFGEKTIQERREDERYQADRQSILQGSGRRTA